MPQPTIQPKPGSPPKEAIAQLIDTHGSQVYSLALRFCGNPQNAADVVQETFLGAYKSWSGFRGDSSASTWLYRIAHRACQRFLGAEGRQGAHAVPLETDLPAHGPVPDVLQTSETPLTEAVRQEAIEALQQEISNLPDGYRLPIILKEIAGLSVAETAEVLDMKEATVKTRLHRGRLALYNALTKSVSTREAPPPVYDTQVCLDLLHAKQEALDRGVAFPQMDTLVCERCRAVFTSLEIAADLCRASVSELPQDLRETILARLDDAA